MTFPCGAEALTIDYPLLWKPHSSSTLIGVYRMKRFVVYTAIIFLLFGTLLGGFLFSDTQPRSVLSIHKCGNCLSANEFAGLVGSVITLKSPDLIPGKILETDRTIVFKHPFSSYTTHYVLVPKKDINENIHPLPGDDAGAHPMKNDKEGKFIRWE